MDEKIRIENLQESNVEDLIFVCSSKRLADPIHQQGVKLKRQWLREMLEKYGSIAKIAYYDDKPVAQILYYPETADITKRFTHENALLIQCIYNPTAETQKLGIGTRLLRSVIQDAKSGNTCLGDKSCRFILASAFNTGEALPMPNFYAKNGFLPTPEANVLCLSIWGTYEPGPPLEEYEPLPDDKDKAIILYAPTCQFSYSFAKKVEQLIKEVSASIKIELINEWEKPEESKKRGNWWLTVNAVAIHTFFMETDKFIAEIRQAVS